MRSPELTTILDSLADAVPRIPHALWHTRQNVRLRRTLGSERRKEIREFLRVLSEYKRGSGAPPHRVLYPELTLLQWWAKYKELQTEIKLLKSWGIDPTARIGKDGL